MYFRQITLDRKNDSFFQKKTAVYAYGFVENGILSKIKNAFITYFFA